MEQIDVTFTHNAMTDKLDRILTKAWDGCAENGEVDRRGYLWEAIENNQLDPENGPVLVEKLTKNQVGIIVDESINHDTQEETGVVVRGTTWVVFRNAAYVEDLAVRCQANDLTTDYALVAIEGVTNRDLTPQQESLIERSVARSLTSLAQKLRKALWER